MAARTALQLDNAFWRFSLAVYFQNGVASECLSLQEGQGIDVNLLLYCAWLGRRGISMSSSDLAVASEAVHTWHDAVVRPLRQTRKAVKELASDKFEHFRGRLKSLELEAEQIEQALLFQAAPAPAGHGAMREAVIAANIAELLGRQNAPRLMAAALAFEG